MQLIQAAWGSLDGQTTFEDARPCQRDHVINQDLVALKAWGEQDDIRSGENASDGCVAEKCALDASGIMFDNEELSMVDDTTLVGPMIDRRMRWSLMVDKIATNAKQRIGARSRVRHLLDIANLMTIYVMFIRSIME